MARRSSGFGLGFGLLVIIGVIASVPKEAWIGLAVLGCIGFILYSFLKGRSKTDAATSALVSQTYVAPLTQVSVNGIDPSVTSASCWTPIGNKVTVKGLTIPGGMLYVGKGLADVIGSDVEPALINPNIPVQMPTGSVDQMGYWPSYSNVTSVARGEYLQWLAGGRQDPTVQLGCVFLFFYGLERKVLEDSPHYSEVSQELPAILAEVRRLIAIYGGNSSFYGCANRFLDLEVIVGAMDRVYRLPAPPQGQYKALTLRHKVALGQAAVDGAPLPAEWAYAWLINDERMFLRTPAQRCPEEFKKLFFAQYAEKFGDGLKFPINKTKLKTLYKPASSSFGYGHVELTGTDLPDVMILEGPFNKLKEIVERSTAQLEAYSRYLGKNPDKRESMDALVLLPPQLWPAESVHSLKSWFASLGVDKSAQVTTFGELVRHFSAWQGVTKDGVAAFSSALEQLGVGMEPDVRWGGILPSEDSQVVLFPITAEEKGAEPSTLYSAATLTLHLAVAVTAADGEVSAAEKEHLGQQLERWLHLGSAERTRLRAHLRCLLVTPPALTALKKRVSGLNEEQKRGVAAFLINVAQADGGVSADEVKVMTKVYRLFGLDEKELFSHVHTAATEPISVKPATQGVPGFGVPPKPAAKSASGIILDHDRIAALKADTERVAIMLGAIFTEESKPVDSAPSAELEAAPAGVSIVGLDTGHSEFVRLLISRDVWTRAELEDLASDRCIMLDGALEHINEAFLDAHGETLLDGDDLFQINKTVAKELEAA